MEEKLGVVVIGRNEAAHIVSCLESVKPLGVKIVYVDSGSVDGCPELARPLCDHVVLLDPSKPFSAARARNEGFRFLTDLEPGIEYVQFLDADCTVLPGWTESALNAFRVRESVVVAIGHLVERHPERSVYNRLCSLEWKSPAGDVSNHGALGGIMMVRVETFRSLRGFNEQVIAGEDSEFGVRAVLAGGVISKLDQPMATHDANMQRFSQWWKRSVRAGHAIGQRNDLNGSSGVRDCAHEKKSTLAWGIGLPLISFVFLLVDVRLLLLPVSAYVLLFFRILAFRRRWGDSPADACLYGFFTVIGKIANGWGLLKYYRRRITGLFTIIEYK